MVIAAILLAGYFTGALTRSMRRVIATFAEIEAGRYENKITVDSTDEPGQVLRSLDKMQSTLRNRIEADRAALTLRLAKPLQPSPVEGRHSWDSY